MSEQNEDELLKELSIPKLIVPPKWPSRIDEADLKHIKNTDTRKILLRLSQLQEAVNWVIDAQVQCREFQILTATVVNKMQLELLSLRGTSRTATGWGNRIKWALLIVSAVVLQELAKRYLLPTKP